MTAAENLVYHEKELQLMGYGESDSSGAWIKFQIEPEDLEKFRGLKGTEFHVVLVKLNSNTGEPEPQKRKKKPRTPPAEGPYGENYKTLHIKAFFNERAVCEAIGTDKQFLAWLRKQPCAKTGKFDYNKDEATGVVKELCEAAHYRSIEDGAGVGIKPLYSAIPLVHAWHLAQTDFGYAAMAGAPTAASDYGNAAPTSLNECGSEGVGREWFVTQRDKYVALWVKTCLYKLFDVRSMRQVPPQEFYAWAQMKGLTDLIPKKFLKGGK